MSIMSYLTVTYEVYVKNNICQYGCQRSVRTCTIQPAAQKLSKVKLSIVKYIKSKK